MYLYRAVDSQGKILEFHLSATRDAEAAKQFFAKALGASHTVTPRMITVDKNAAYPKAVHELKAAGTLASACELRQSKFLNNLIEQDHRVIKRRVKPGLGFVSFKTAWRTLQGYVASPPDFWQHSQARKQARSKRRLAHSAQLSICQPVEPICLQENAGKSRCRWEKPLQETAGRPWSEGQMLGVGMREAPAEEPPMEPASPTPLLTTLQPVRRVPLLRLSRGRLQPPHRLVHTKIRQEEDHGSASQADP